MKVNWMKTTEPKYCLQIFFNIYALSVLVNYLIAVNKILCTNEQDEARNKN